MFNYITNKEEYQESLFSNSTNKRYILREQGKVLSNGIVIEHGGMFLDKETDMYTYVSESTDGSYIKVYNPIKNMNEFLVNWEAVIKLVDGTSKIQTFESTSTIRKLIANFTIGSTFETTDKCPDIPYWLCKSVVDNEVEYYFNIESTEQLHNIAAYYKLEYPSNDLFDNLIDNHRMAIRFKSYDIGINNFVSIIPGSIVFKDGIPAQLKLYVTMRYEDGEYFAPNEMSYFEQCVDNYGEVRIFKKTSYEEKIRSIINYKFPEMNKFNFRSSGIGYNQLLNSTVYSAILVDLPLNTPEGINIIEIKYAEDIDYCCYKAAYEYSEITPEIELPMGSTGVFFAKYFTTSFGTDVIEPFASIHDVYFRNNNTQLVCEQLGIDYNLLDGNTIHFGITYNKDTKEILRAKAYFYPNNDIIGW